MKNYFFKPELENLSQGARLKFVRELRYMSKPNVAEFLELGGEKPTDSIDKYERNAREPQAERLEDLAELFDVSNYAIRRYNFVDPNEVIYYTFNYINNTFCPKFHVYHILYFKNSIFLFFCQRYGIKKD